SENTPAQQSAEYEDPPEARLLPGHAGPRFVTATSGGVDEKRKLHHSSPWEKRPKRGEQLSPGRSLAQWVVKLTLLAGSSDFSRCFPPFFTSPKAGLLQMNPSGSSRLPAMKSPLMSLAHASAAALSACR